MNYRIRRDDGEEIEVDVSCTADANAAARAANNTAALEQMDSHHTIVVVQAADKLPPPSQGGPTLIRVWFDPNHSGKMRTEPPLDRFS